MWIGLVEFSIRKSLAVHDYWTGMGGVGVAGNAGPPYWHLLHPNPVIVFAFSMFTCMQVRQNMTVIIRLAAVIFEVIDAPDTTCPCYWVNQVCWLMMDSEMTACEVFSVVPIKALEVWICLSYIHISDQGIINTSTCRTSAEDSREESKLSEKHLLGSAVVLFGLES